jgi:hypothetical protein
MSLVLDGTNGITTLPVPLAPAQVAVVNGTILPSMVRLNTANGYGSTNTMIRRFTNTVASQGTDITYADSAALGASFTVNASGIYAISYVEDFTPTGTFGVSLNSSQLTTNIFSIAATDRLTENTTAPGSSASCSIILYLLSGAIIRPHADASASVGTRQSFTITRVA